MDIKNYLERIHFQLGEVKPGLETLEILQQTHMQAVPFENLSVHYKQPIVLNEETLYKKIVGQNRGGFCYELNGLFAWLLRELGYRVTMLSAGVARKDGGFGPEFDHMTLMVHLDENYLVDVGFGDSFQTPLRFSHRGEQSQGGKSYQIAAEGEAFVVYEQNNRDEKPSMQAQYRFTLSPRQMKDYEDMCHYHQTSPESSFTQKRVCSLASPNGRYTLSDFRFIITEDGIKHERELASEEEFRRVLKEYFNINLGSVR
jgi:N-hydroxyarylamine O-acetyltransferase